MKEQNHSTEILSFHNTPLSRAADSTMPFIYFLVLPYPTSDTTSKILLSWLLHSCLNKVRVHVWYHVSLCQIGSLEE